MRKPFKTRALPLFLSIIMVACMMPQPMFAQEPAVVIPSDYVEAEAALRSDTPKTIEINKEITLNSEIVVGANHTLSISSGGAIYLGGDDVKLDVPSGVTMTINGGGKLRCDTNSAKPISVSGNLALEDINLEMNSPGSTINFDGKLSATDCDIVILKSRIHLEQECGYSVSLRLHEEN